MPEPRSDGDVHRLHICRSGRHCTYLTGITPDGRCLACRRESHRRAQYRYRDTAKGQQTLIRDIATQRGAS